MTDERDSDTASDSHTDSSTDAVDFSSIDSIKAHDWSDFDLRDAERGVEKPYSKPEVLAYLYWIEGETQTEIGERYGVSGRTVCYHMQKEEVPRETDPAHFSASVHYGFEAVTDRTYSWVWSAANGEQYGAYVHQITACVENDPHDVFGEDTEVDHASGHPLDNRPEALEVINQTEHRKRHAGKAEWVIEDGEPRHYRSEEAPDDARDPIEEWWDGDSGRSLTDNGAS